MNLPCRIADVLEMIHERFFGPREFTLGNNLVLTVSILFQEPVITIKKEGEVLLDFKELIPKDVVFKFDTNFGWGTIPNLHSCHFNTLVIGEFKEIGDFFLLLHEISILNNKSEVELAYDAFLLYHEEVYLDNNNAYPDTRLKALKVAMEASIQCERNTWATALKNVRKLDKRFNTSVVSCSGGIQKIKILIDKCLKSKEDYFLQRDLYSLGYTTRESALNCLENL